MEEQISFKGYKWFIDQLVELANQDIIANRIRSNQHPERTNELDLALSSNELDRKNFFLSLSAKQRKLLTEMLGNQRHGAIHDVACFLEGQISSGNLEITIEGKELSESPFASFHYDFISRVEGDEWP